MERPPVQLLEQAINAGCMFNRRPANARPGGIISNMSDANRKILAELRSTDIATLRTDFVRIYLPEPDPGRQLALEFDARIPKHFRVYPETTGAGSARYRVSTSRL